MNSDIAALIGELALFPGIDGCALVESETGMAWHHAGEFPDMEAIGETAVEFWRIQGRLSPQLAALGSLKSAAYSFSNRVLALFPCCDDPALVLVCVASRCNMDWQGWSVRVLPLIHALSSRPSATAARQS